MQDVLNSDNFVLTNGHRIPRNSKIIIMDFRTLNQGNVACCNEFAIFGESVSEDLSKLQLQNDLVCDYDEFNEIESNETMIWYQSSYVMKGFKDCVVNGSSVTNTWLES